MEEVNIVVRWGHLLLGVSWIGMLHYFNFVQGGFFKANSRIFFKKKHTSYASLIPVNLRWFRWITGIMLTTAMYLLWTTNSLFSDYIFFSVLMSLCMIVNVIVFIWPAQQIALGLKSGDRIEAADRAFSALRTNHLFCLLICLCLIFSFGSNQSEQLLVNLFSEQKSLSLFVSFSIIIALELNIVFGRQLMKSSQQAFAQTSATLAGVLYIALTFI